MDSHTEDFVDRETAMMNDSGWQMRAIQLLLVDSSPPETGGCRWEMSEGEVSQQDEDEKAVHCQVLLALFISRKGGLR